MRVTPFLVIIVAVVETTAAALGADINSTFAANNNDHEQVSKLSHTISSSSIDPGQQGDGDGGVFFAPSAPPLGAPPPVVVLLPALGQAASSSPVLRRTAAALAASGMAVLVMPGVGTRLDDAGGSGGGGKFPAYRCAALAAHRALEQLAARGKVDAERVAFWGIGFGAAVAANAATIDKGAVVTRAVILQVCARVCGFFLGGVLVKCDKISPYRSPSPKQYYITNPTTPPPLTISADADAAGLFVAHDDGFGAPCTTGLAAAGARCVKTCHVGG